MITYQYFQPAPDRHGNNIMLDFFSVHRREYRLVYNGRIEHITKPWKTLDTDTQEQVFQMLWIRHNASNRSNSKTIRAISPGDIIVIGGETWLNEYYKWTKLSAIEIPSVMLPYY